MQVGASTIGSIAQARKPLVTSTLAVQLAPEEWPANERLVAFAGYPLLVDSKLVGVLAMFAPRDFSSSALDAMARRRCARIDESRWAIDRNALRTSELATLVAQLRVTQQQAEAATRAKSDFLASMSHELRTPLNAIILYSELLQEEAADNQQRRTITDLKRIQSAGNHLLELINGILDLSKIEAGKMTLSLEQFDVRALVRRSWSTPSARWCRRTRTPDRALCGRSQPDAHRHDEDAADPAQPAEQRRQVHARRHDHAGGRARRASATCRRSCSPSPTRASA